MNRLLIAAMASTTAVLLAATGCAVETGDSAAGKPPPADSAPPVKSAAGDLPWEDAFEDAFKAFDAIQQCLDNEAKGIPCTQSTGSTVDEIYAMFSQFMQEYAVDAYNTRNSLNTIITSQNKAALTEQWHQVDDDLGQGQTMFQVYASWLACSKALSDKAATCQAANVDGVTSEQPATQQTIDGLSDILVKINNGDPTVGAVAWKHSWKQLLPLISGNVKSPYVSSDSSLLHDMFTYAAGSQVQQQGLDADANLVFFPADFVNGVSGAISDLINLESMYAMARIAALSIQAKSAATPTPASTAALAMASDMYIQLTGRDPNSGAPVTPQQVIVPTMEGQLDAYAFPGWSPKQPLAENQAYVSGPKTKPTLITFQGNTTSVPSDTSSLPTDAQLAAISSDIGQQWSESTQKIKPGNKFKGQYDYLSSVYPKVLPPRTASSSYSDSSVGRWWSAPQPVWLTTENNSASVRNNSGDPYHPFYYTYPGHVGPNGITGLSNGTRLPVVVLASNLAVGGKPMTPTPGAKFDPSTWTEQALPYNIYPAVTDTQGKSGFFSNSGTAPLTVTGTPFSTYATGLPTNKSDTTSAMVQPLTKYPVGYSSPVWDGFAISNAQPGQTISYPDSNHSQGFGSGLLVQPKLESANVTVTVVTPGGALQDMTGAKQK